MDCRGDRIPTISIIVPVYKVEAYLPQCVESILSQTFTEFDLLLVDDGSPDGSGQLCDEYAVRDTRIRVIHKENGGLSSARNVGVQAATGEYILLLDGDDFLRKDAVERLLAACLLSGVSKLKSKMSRARENNNGLPR